MLTRGPRRRQRVEALVPVVSLLFLLAVGSASPIVRADPPIEIENQDASRTVGWAMGDPAGLTLDGVALEGGNATLPWEPLTLSWTDPAAFVANGTVDSSLTAGPADITLRADDGNHVRGGDFASGENWTYEGSAAGNVSAAWDAATGTALFRHSSLGTEASWDGMDSNPGTWLGVNGVVWTNTTEAHQPPGMLGLNFSLPESGGWAGIQHAAPVDWSGADRLALWVSPAPSSLPLTLNVTAYVDSTFHDTRPRVLAAGGQEVVVDLTELGPTRDALVSLTLRVDGRNVSGGTVFFDDLRIGSAKRFDETAQVRQDVTKVNTTSSAPGSAVLRLNWSLPTLSGLARAVGFVDVTGPSGSTVTTFSASPGSGGSPFIADVSRTSSLPGLYTVRVGFRVIADNTSASVLDARIDDVSIHFPNRHNGTYLSGAVPLGVASEFLQVRWDFDASAPTAILAAIRTGGDATPGSPSWSPWQAWTAGGARPSGLSAGSFLQVRVDLSTDNASVTPTFRGMVLETRHRSMTPGTISGTFTVPVDDVQFFLHWRTMLVQARTPPGTSISFAMGNSTHWMSVTPGTGLVDARWTTILWSATMATTDGLVTPSLLRLDLVYEYLGPAVRVEIDWRNGVGPIQPIAVGQPVALTAVALDAGFHVVTSSPDAFDWVTDEARGHMEAGVYTPKVSGVHFVTARFRGTALSATIMIRAGPSWIDSLPLYAFAAGALAALGYAGYQFGVRRMFKIEDIFLIGRDGRLLLHNTRRMRADRDEDILSGMLTAIVAFLKDSDPEENGELKRFEIGRKTTLIERGAHAYLAVVYSGRVPRWAGKDLKKFMTHLEANFGTAFAKWSGDPEDIRGLKEFTGQFVSRLRYRRPRRVNGRAA